jgi:hypothetical protein
MSLLTSRQQKLVALFIVVALLVGAGVATYILKPGRPVVRFQPSDRNVSPGQETVWNFDSDPVGGLPAGIEVFDGTWTVRAEEGAPTPPNALCQTATADFPALTLSDKVYTDVDVSVRFKPVSGSDDQAAGIIFRVQDKENYYILRANALEDNVILFIYASGKRTSIKESEVKVPSSQWQELRVEVIGNSFRGFLNGQPVLEATDDNYKAGRVGLWTKADSVTCFDNLRVTAK